MGAKGRWVLALASEEGFGGGAATDEEGGCRGGCGGEWEFCLL